MFRFQDQFLHDVEQCLELLEVGVLGNGIGTSWECQYHEEGGLSTKLRANLGGVYP